MTRQPAFQASIEALLHSPLQKHLAVFHHFAFVYREDFAVSVDVVSQMIIPEGGQTGLVMLRRPGRLLRPKKLGDVHVRLCS